MTFLGLEDNIISNVGTKWLSKGNWKGLKYLLLRNNGDISKKGFDSLSKVSANLLYELSIGNNTSMFPQNLYYLFKGEFLYKLNANVTIRSRGRDRDDIHQVEANTRSFTKLLTEKYRLCRMQERDQVDEEDW